MAIAAVAVLLLPSAASGAWDARLKRYPYLTDLVGSNVMVNWATDISFTSGVVKWGLNGSNCQTHQATATRTFMLVNGVSEYQWKAQITGLAPDTEYCYRVYFGSTQVDLLGTDPSPVFRSQVPAGSSQPFKFAVFGNWGKTLAGGNQHQTNVITQIAQSGARFAVTAGDNAYEAGSERSYGDLYQTGDNTSGVFGPNFWKLAGASVPIFPATGNHDHNNLLMLKNWPQDTAVATSGGVYESRSYCCTNDTNPGDYPTTWYAFDAGLARFYVLETAWENQNVGTANLFKNDFDNHWEPDSEQYQWLKNDLETHPRALRFAFHHFPMYSDQSATASDTFLQGAGSLEGLLKLHDVTLNFNAHSHNYQRNAAPPGGIPSYVTGGGGANLESIGNHSAGCSPLDQYGLGWSNVNDTPHACGAAPLPTGKDKVHHFLLVSVSGTSVTVTPTNSLGETFDVQTYNAPALSANLSLTKTDAPDPVTAGQVLTYNLTVGNSGPRAASGTRVTDTLPASVIFESATSSQGTCSQASGTVTCELGTVASGGSATVQIKVRPQTAMKITNSASVTSDLTDPSPGNNTASVNTDVKSGADLALTKTGSPDPVGAGQQLTYTLDVNNAGPSTGGDVKLTDNLPGGVTYTSATPSQGNCSHKNGKVTCSLGNMTSGTNATVTIKVTPPSTGVITNEATVDSKVADPDLSNNDASTATTVSPLANLSLTKSDAPDPARVGELLTYNLTVANAGPSGAPEVTVTDALPAGVTFDSATSSQGSCSEASGTVTCALGTIPNGQSAGIEISVTPETAGEIINQASVSSNSVDPSPANNSASASTTVEAGADLSLTKTDSADPVGTGQPLTYTLTVHNAGPQDADGVSLTDSLPGGVALDSVTPTQGTCSEESGTVTCELGTIADQAGASVEIDVRGFEPGTISNQAEVASDVFDPDPPDNSAGAETVVEPTADLALAITDSPDPVLAGELVVYTLSVTNAGLQHATDVTLDSTLPTAATYDSATPSQGSCAEAAGIVTCALGTLPAAGTATVDIALRPSTGGTITNEASVTSSVGDPVPADNSASAETTVRATPIGYPRPRAASPVTASLVPAYAECTAPNRTHGPSLDFASCSPPEQRSTFLTVGTPDANSAAASMAGTVRFSAIAGDVGTAADEADVRISIQATDIRDRVGLGDYTGELEGRVLLRITDRLNGVTGGDTATVADVPYAITVPCASTGGAADVGATCSVNTTADAITPGMVTETKRTIWEMREIAVLDGGADGDAETDDNTVFLRQGLFIP